MIEFLRIFGNNDVREIQIIGDSNFSNYVTTEITVRGVAGSAVELCDINGKSVMQQSVAIDAEI